MRDQAGVRLGRVRGRTAVCGWTRVCGWAGERGRTIATDFVIVWL